VHGGAGGRAPRDEGPYREALEAALAAGWAVLAAGGPALDAAQAAVEPLEDAPWFNAGRGSVLTAAGTVEMDAAVACGSERRTGAVACVTRVRHPVALARAVMERTPHVLMAGRGAEALAVREELELMNPDWFVTPRERERLGRVLDRAAGEVRPEPGGEAAPGGEAEPGGGGTVGAVARDAEGRLAAATSTGGMRGQLPGRVGDSPLFGAGTYADERCAVSATGDGEATIRAVAAYEVARLVAGGAPVEEAGRRVLEDGLGPLGGSGGLIAVGAEGDPGLPFTSAMMFRAARAGSGEPRVAIGPGPP
jgi:isoaspartyl peptidase/L-asparaginase-like protein (Ntn-hydrolase superfamily)